MERKAANLLATVLLSGEWSRAGCLDSLRRHISSSARKSKWPANVIDGVFGVRGFSVAPSQNMLRQFLQNAAASGAIGARAVNSVMGWAAGFDRLNLPRPKMMSRIAKASFWKLPEIVTTGALADCLKCCPNRLDWLGDIRSQERKLEKEKLRNYRYSWVKKQSGSLRLLECPKFDLKQIQRWILSNVLDNIPAHQSAHGFVTNRSPISAAKVHVNQHVVLRIDLQNFFTAITAARVAGIFQSVGYPVRVARLLTGLCTNTAWEGALDEISPDPTQVANHKSQHRRLFIPHLPQGAPSSPTLANLAAYSLDCRLSGLAEKFGANYSRYADDLVFSGDRHFACCLADFRIRCLSIVHNEGFEIRQRKTQVMHSGEQQKVTGVVVNKRPNIDRSEFDLLKATLHNCVVHGPKLQNRTGVTDIQSHLLGRIAWVKSLNATRGQKLMALFRKIQWNQNNAQQAGPEL